MSGIRRRMKKAVSLLMVLMLFSATIFAQTSGDYVQGKTDGKTDGAADASAMWIVWGVACGCFAMGATYMISSAPPSEKLIGKSSDYVMSYSESYRKSVRSKKLIYSTIGTAAWMAVYYVFLLPSLGGLY